MPDGNVFVVTGDFTYHGTLPEIVRFAKWLDTMPYEHKIVIAGNHDWLFQKGQFMAIDLLKENCPDAIYLEDSGCVVDGIRFWGSPWQPWFFDWAFNLPRDSEAIQRKWDLIPKETDVLLTHTPPYGIMDITREGKHVGCERLTQSLQRIQPKAHIFGHIHESYGILERGGTIFANASSVNRNYRLVNDPVVIEI